MKQKVTHNPVEKQLLTSTSCARLQDQNTPVVSILRRGITTL